MTGIARDFGFVVLRGLLLSALVLLVSLPMVNFIHRHFGLGAAPFNGLFLMFFALITAFVGAAMVGALSGIYTPSHKSFTPWVTLGGLVWGFGVLLWFVPCYAGMVADDIVRSSATYVLHNRNDIVPRAQSAIEAFQQGQTDKTKKVFMDSAAASASAIGMRTASQVPALLVLSWAILVPPLLAVWEYRLARQRTAISYVQAL